MFSKNWITSKYKICWPVWTVLLTLFIVISAWNVFLLMDSHYWLHKFWIIWVHVEISQYSGDFVDLVHYHIIISFFITLNAFEIVWIWFDNVGSLCWKMWLEKCKWISVNYVGNMTIFTIQKMIYILDRSLW